MRYHNRHVIEEEKTMSTRRDFLCGLGAVLLLTAGAQAQTPPDPKRVPTPADVVQQYLTARAAHDYTQAYAQFSATVHQEIPYAQFAEGKDIPSAASHADEDRFSPLMMALSVLFTDSHDQMGYRFTVLGPDPSDTHTVQVQARPGKASPTDAFLLKIVTAPDAAGVPHIEMQPSYQKTSPAGATSLSNLRQIGLAMMQYAQDHQFRMPDADQWVGQISPYLAGETAAPEEQERIIESLMHDPASPTGQKWNYAFNSRLSGLSLAHINIPEQTVLVFESITGAKNKADAGTSVPHPGRHDGGSYYVSADGRAHWSADVSRLNFAP
jgi:hypothetical protein